MTKTVEKMMAGNETAKEIYEDTKDNLKGFDEKRQGALLALYALACADVAFVREHLQSGVVTDYQSIKSWHDLLVMHNKRLIEAGKNLKLFESDPEEEGEELEKLLGAALTKDAD